MVFYKQPKALDVEHKETMMRIMQRKGTRGFKSKSVADNEFCHQLEILRG